MFYHHQKGGDCWSKGAILNFVLKITYNMKSFSTNQVLVSKLTGFKSKDLVLLKKEGFEVIKLIQGRDSSLDDQNANFKETLLIKT